MDPYVYPLSLWGACQTVEQPRPRRQKLILWWGVFCLVVLPLVGAANAADHSPVEINWDETVSLLRKEVELYPGSYEITVKLARALVHTGHRQEALTLLWDLASQSRGKRRELLQRQARVLSRMFLANEGFQIFQDGVNLLVAGKLRPAAEKLERVLNTEPENVEVLARLAQTKTLLEDYESAAELLKKANKENPMEPVVHLWLGRVLYQRGERTKALAEMKSAERDLKNSELAKLWLAEAVKSSGQVGEATQILEKHTSAQPLHLKALLALAGFHLSAAGFELGKDLSVNKVPKLRFEEQVRELWTARKKLQLVLSRTSEYSFEAPMANAEGSENPASSSSQIQLSSDLGLDYRNAEEIKARAQDLLDQIEKLLSASRSA